MQRQGQARILKKRADLEKEIEKEEKQSERRATARTKTRSGYETWTPSKTEANKQVS